MMFLLAWMIGAFIMTAAWVIYGIQINRQAEREKQVGLDIWTDLDGLLMEVGYAAVLKYLPDSVRDDFTPAGQPCPDPRTGLPPVHRWRIDYDRSGQETVWKCPCGVRTKNRPPVGLQNAQLFRKRDEAVKAKKQIEASTVGKLYDARAEYERVVFPYRTIPLARVENHRQPW